MSELRSLYVIPCPGCWNPEEGNQASLEIEKDWNGSKYIFLSAYWECSHCDRTGSLKLGEVTRLPSFREVDCGE